MSDDVITQRIVASTSKVFHFREAELRGQRRHKNLVLARQVAMYLIRQETNCPLAVVGRTLGSRTPATISFGYQKVARNLCSQPQLRVKVAAIKKLVFTEDAN